MRQVHRWSGPTTAHLVLALMASKGTKNRRVADCIMRTVLLHKEYRSYQCRVRIMQLCPLSERESRQLRRLPCFADETVSLAKLPNTFTATNSLIQHFSQVDVDGVLSGHHYLHPANFA